MPANGGEESGSETTIIDEHEAEYQLYRNISKGEPLPAEVTAVSVERGWVLLELSLSDGPQFVIEFKISADGLHDLRQMYAGMGYELTSDLSTIVNETVTIQLVEDDQRQLLFPSIDIAERRVLADDGLSERRLQTQLDSEYLTALSRLERYKENDMTPCLVPVTGMDATETSLTLTIDLCGEPYTDSVEIPDQIGGSQYERLVEEVGYGSVTQIADGELYAIRSVDCGDYSGSPIATVEDAFSKWLLFSEREAARQAAKPSNRSSTDGQPSTDSLDEADPPQEVFDHAPPAAKLGILLMFATGVGLLAFVSSAVLIALGIEAALPLLRGAGVLTLLFGGLFVLLVKLDRTVY